MIKGNKKATNTRRKS